MKTSRRVAFLAFLSIIVINFSSARAHAQNTPPPPSAPPAQNVYSPNGAPQNTPQNNGPENDASSVPGRAVNLRYISGQVSIQPAGVDDWVEAAVNRPLTTADKVWADKDSRAELHLGTSAIRISSETSMTLTNVGDQAVQVELDQGELNLDVRKVYDGETYEIDTQNLAFTITKPGDYRFDMDPNAGTTKVTVLKGEGEVTGQGQSVKLSDGQQTTFSNGQSLQHDALAAGKPDAFDDWCRTRDEQDAKSESAKYVAQDVSGASDLDAYGKWRDLPGYGPVWAPAVAPGWAPYHYGHWVWIAPWGWTWVDAAPWGYAPFHYGRWVFVGGFWGWSPGPIYVRPAYAPALVGWVGGPGWGVGVSFGVGFGVGGGVGWFPLGYREPYYPAYGGRTVINNVNVTNVTNVYNNTGTVNTSNTNTGTINYANRNVPGAMTAVPTSTLTNSTPVEKSAVSVPASEAAKAPLQSVAPVTPTQNSVRGGPAANASARPPASLGSHPVATRMQPPAKPAPFSAQRSALAQNPGHPLSPQTAQQLRSNGAAQQTHTVPRPPQTSQESRPSSPENNIGRNNVSDAKPANSTKAPHHGKGHKGPKGSGGGNHGPTAKGGKR